MIITVNTSAGKYDIILERGAINRLADYIDVNKKALVVTDSGVPSDYAKTVSKQFSDSLVYTFQEGEGSKNFQTYTDILRFLSDNNYDRSSVIVAVGGGVVGDLSGFVASTYMRGIDFINIPTTLLAQVDSSIGGKTAVDFNNLKNLVGTFYAPKAVIIDADVLNTLPKRQFNNGIAESIKMAATSDSEFFSLLENNDSHEITEEIIYRSLLIKKAVVEQDEKEKGLRKVLNFGHTAGHAVETAAGFGTLLHGECVSIGMMYMCGSDIKERLKSLLIKNDLPVKAEFDTETLLTAARHDKKSMGDSIELVRVEKIGSFEFKKVSFSELELILKEGIR